MEIRSDRRYSLDLGRDVVWGSLARVERYPTWWPWLREFDGTRLATGERWRCVVRPPLPYLLRFAVVLTDVVDEHRVEARVDGDIVGEATLTLTARPGGCEIRIVSRLSPASRLLRAMAGLARPVAVFGHDWVMDTGLRQFRANALGC